MAKVKAVAVKKTAPKQMKMAFGKKKASKKAC